MSLLSTWLCCTGSVAHVCDTVAVVSTEFLLAGGQPQQPMQMYPNMGGMNFPATQPMMYNPAYPQQQPQQPQQPPQQPHQQNPNAPFF